MKKTFVAILLAIASVVSLFTIPASAANSTDFDWSEISSSNPIKLYVDKKITTYTSKKLASRSGSIFSGDLVSVIKVYDNEVARVEYPTSSGKKKAYVSLDAIGFGDSEDWVPFTADHNVAVYRQADLSKKYGTIYEDDTCWLIASDSHNAFVLYPIGRGFKAGYLNTEDVSIEEEEATGLLDGFPELLLDHGKYMQANDITYYSFVDEYIDPNSKLRLEWVCPEDDLDYIQVYIKRLTGDPNPSSSNEDGELLYAKETSKHYCTISTSKLRSCEGKYLKVSLQGCSDDGNAYTRVVNFYLFVGVDSKEETPEAPSEPERAPQVYLQYASPWGTHPYGHKDLDCTEDTTLSFSGCGVLAYVNAIYHLTGKFVDPTLIADYAMTNGHRVCGEGTAKSLYKAFARSYGNEYGFTFGESYTRADFNSMKEAIQNGSVLIANVPDHFIAIVEYDAKRDAFLVLDSYPTSGRGTTKLGDWKTIDELSTGKLKINYFVTLEKRK